MNARDMYITENGVVSYQDILRERAERHGRPLAAVKSMGSITYVDLDTFSPYMGEIYYVAYPTYWKYQPGRHSKNGKR